MVILDPIGFSTDVFDKAIEHPDIINGETLYCKPGIFIFEKLPQRLCRGLKIKGAGTVGANADFGTLFVCKCEMYPYESFLCWNGWYRYSGTGGGLEDIIIARGYKKQYGKMIELTGSDDSHRCGYFTLTRVLSLSTSVYGTWDYCLVVDGTAITTVNSSGIRGINMNGVELSGADKDTILLKNAVSLKAVNTRIYTSKGSASSIRIEGGEDIDIRGSMYGNLHLENCKNVRYDGLITGIIECKDGCSGRIDLTGKPKKITKPLNSEVSITYPEKGIIVQR